MAERGRMPVYINPLAFMDVELASDPKTQPTAESILAFLCSCQPGTSKDLASLIERYRQISTEPVRLVAAPVETRIMEKLIVPLQQAKASYMLANYLGVIGLCGIVSEMVAVLHWELAEATVNGQSMTPGKEGALFGSSFERLGQERRVRVLDGYGIIDKATVQMFDTIRQNRRRYLHLWSQDHDRLPTDAVSSFHAAVGLVVGVIGQNFDQGAFLLNPKLLKYLERKGVYEPPREPVVAQPGDEEEEDQSSGPFVPKG